MSMRDKIRVVGSFLFVLLVCGGTVFLAGTPKALAYHDPDGGTGDDSPEDTSIGDEYLTPPDFSEEEELVLQSQEFSEKLAGYLGKFTLVFISISSFAFVLSLLFAGVKYAGGGEGAMLAKQQIKRSVGFFAFLAGLNVVFGIMYFFLRVV